MRTNESIQQIVELLKITPAEAKERGLAPKSGDWNAPGQWILDDKAKRDETKTEQEVDRAKQQGASDERNKGYQGHRNRATWAVGVLDLIPDEILQEELEEMDISTMTRQEAKFALADSAQSMVEADFEMAQDALEEAGFGWMSDFIDTSDIDYDSLVEHIVDDYDLFEFKDDIEERESEASTVYRREQDKPSEDRAQGEFDPGSFYPR